MHHISAGAAGPDVILLDWMLPGMNGLEVCRRLRSETSDVWIIMLSVRGREVDRVLGLEYGADDYLTKPFSLREVVALVRRALRRRAGAGEKSVCRFDSLDIDFRSRRVMKDGREVKLTRKEFALLAHLVKSAGRVATRQQLLDSVWGYSYFGDTRTLDVHIRRLRQKLGDCGNCIETVVGIGYRFIGQK